MNKTLLAFVIINVLTIILQSYKKTVITANRGWAIKTYDLLSTCFSIGLLVKLSSKKRKESIKMRHIFSLCGK